MNQYKTVVKTTLALLLAGAVVTPAMAAFTLNGTRFIYEEGKKNISLEVTNNAKDTYGGQVWTDNVSQNKADVFMVPSPPFFKVDAGKKQVLRLMNVNPDLPADRESLFRINVQEIPPKPKNTEGSVIAIAMNTQVKLIYRPKALADGRKDAEKQLTAVQKAGRVWLKNPTPYYFAVTALKVNGKTVTIPQAKQAGLATLAPFSEVDTGLSSTGRLTAGAINDWGGVQDYDVK
ncbi:fimbrial chaperone [Citrobacter werkmanii]|nr:fimbrial chaperone [Citrobacter werkmanii]MBQ4937369.1 fimbrial chaperone [Citrobacter werkmanii]MBQ4950082.1 fimbrial chaperone [Citrobacter werkmanii]MBQ4965906.1 fimbrial chaperone [Citrobacter werkmanii]